MGFFTKMLGTKHDRDLKLLLPILNKINEKENWAKSLANDDFKKETIKLKEEFSNGKTLEDLLPESFALAREAARRILGERLYDVQLLGAIVLHQGKIMEMKTGEGKTLSCVPAAFLNSISGQGVHVITVNDYLAERDSKWMEPVFKMLGLSVGSILSNMDTASRKISYLKDICYGTNNEFGFDYLRDNMRWKNEEKVQIKHNYCIIDEIDSILIDEARTPLIISGPAEDDTKYFKIVNGIVNELTQCKKDPETGEYPELPEGDFKLEEKNKRISFTDEGMNHIESLLLKNNIITGSLFSEDNFEFIHYFTQALKAHKLFNKDVDYVVQDGVVEIVDEFTGRILHGRRYSEGLHQAIEAKERIKVAQRNRTLATITFQNFFRMYDKISGMTGTADTEAVEFTKIYNLEVVVIPTNRPLARADEDDVIFYNEHFKNEAICQEINEVNEKGQPILVGTVSIESSEKLSQLLRSKGIKHEILNAKNHAREALIIGEAGAKYSVTIATNMAGRGTDIKLGGNVDYRAKRVCGTDASPEAYAKAYSSEYQKWLNDYNEVKELGGLYILGTERHESRRIDNQLRGRSGRQGDPGKSRFFISLDDDLMRLFGGENLKSLMGKLGMKNGEPLYHPWVNKAMAKAQTKVEDRNFEIRKHLLDYDDVLNTQRTFIYDQREAILKDNDLSKRVIETSKDILDELLTIFSKNKDKQAAQILIDSLKESFFYTPEISTDEIAKTDITNLKETFLKALEADLANKKSKIGLEDLNLFIRYEYLKNIDASWQDHLEQLESLREAVYLRAYGQKNPLTEYKREGFEMFDQLIDVIRYSIAKKILKVQIQSYDGSSVNNRSQNNIQTDHKELGQFTSVEEQNLQSKGNSNQKVQIKRTQPKVGRNDPCPCGSGKKYKKCCGKI